MPLAPCASRALPRASEVRRVPRGRAGAPTVRTARAVRHLTAQTRAHAARIAADVQADAADGARPTLIAADDGLEAHDAVLAAFGARSPRRRRMQPDDPVREALAAAAPLAAERIKRGYLDPAVSQRQRVGEQCASGAVSVVVAERLDGGG